MSYHHVQVGRFYVVTMLVVGFVVALAAVYIGFSGGAVPAATVALLTVPIGAAIVLVPFARLNVGVGDDGDRSGRALRWSMTFGWPAGTIPISEIAAAQIVPVTIWMGIGIHLTSRGWVWNVALGQGVQVRKRDGSSIVLGTDDADGLLAAIQGARAQR
ncbi:MAG: hypothetical protein ABI231_07530 [Candidatus Tumulicola sp.]